jgi:hypothetical protein
VVLAGPFIVTFGMHSRFANQIAIAIFGVADSLTAQLVIFRSVARKG